MEEESQQQQQPPAKKQSKKKIWLGIIAAFLFIGFVSAAGSHSSSTNTVTKQVAPKSETKTITEKQSIPFNTQQVDDSTLLKGQSSTKQEGQNGEKTLIYEVTYTNGSEIARKLVSDTVSLAPIPKIIANGTKNLTPTPPPQPAPSTSQSTATALCVDGTYSYSQHASGTCSHHGGVAQWINHP